jgi:hypothetical protein
MAPAPPASPARRGLSLPDYRSSAISDKHIRRGLCLMIRHLPAALVLALMITAGVRNEWTSHLGQLQQPPYTRSYHVVVRVHRCSWRSA